jgi:hypothetical protein
MTDETWKYHSERLGGLFQSFDIERRVKERLNLLGREGWELITSHRSWLTHKYSLVFKRRIPVRAVV